MNKDQLAGKLLGLKIGIQRWLKLKAENSAPDSERAQRDAEKLIWKLQERYGYSHVRQEQNSPYSRTANPGFTAVSSIQSTIQSTRRLEVPQGRVVQR